MKGKKSDEIELPTDQEIALDRAIAESIGPDGRLDVVKLMLHPVSLGRISEWLEEQRAELAARKAAKLEALACAVAREWSLTSNDPAYHVPLALAKALDALELATRESPLRKVKP